MTRFIRSLDSYEYFTWGDSVGVACEKKEKNPFQKYRNLAKRRATVQRKSRLGA